MTEEKCRKEGKVYYVLLSAGGSHHLGENDASSRTLTRVLYPRNDQAAAADGGGVQKGHRQGSNTHCKIPCIFL